MSLMKKLFEKAKYLLYFADKTKYYGHLGRKINRFFVGGSDMDNTGQTAKAWCRKREIKWEKAIEVITGRKPKYKFEEGKKEVYKEAKSRVENCPFQMGGEGI